MINIKIDSRKINPGDTFVAIKGINSDGHDYIDQAIKSGATKVIAEKGEYEVETIIVEDTKEYLAQLLKDTYGEELKDIKFVGVTGTNGKTTTCYLTYKLLNMLGKKTAYLGTIGFYIDDEITELKNTTPEITDLYDMFMTCKEKNVEVIVMEVSSHALELKRVAHIDFDYAVFTNLTKDHTDFHLTMENYLKAKQLLFTKVKADGYAIINGDDKYYEKFIYDYNHNLIYGVTEKADYRIVDYKLDISKTQFRLDYKGKKYPVTINFPGIYNVYNFLASMIIVHKMGYTIEDVLSYASELKAPPGRTESINYKGAVIIIDYAHTPDAVENVLNVANACKRGKIITIVGCGGDRDRTKRPIMGEIATRLSDKVIFTNDNPRTEDPKIIMNDIIGDLKKDNYEVIYDRQEATTKAMDMLQSGYMLLILGKGHENYQIIGKEYLHYDDKEIVESYIAKKQ